MAFVGTSGLLFGVGFAGSSPALSNGVVNCDGRTVFANLHLPEDHEDEIQLMALSGDLICLSGDFVLDDAVELNPTATSNVVIRGLEKSSGLGKSSITHPGGQVFRSLYGTDAGWDLTIENLTVKQSINPVQGYKVLVKNSDFLNNTGVAVYAEAGNLEVSDSYFSGNSGGVLKAAVDITISKSTFEANVCPVDSSSLNILSLGGTVNATDSTFTDNRTPGEIGGAIAAATVRVSNSTFDGNSSADGGAIFAENVAVKNSTFVNNVATREGGAIYAEGGSVYFSTFLNNTAATPPAPDEPGDTPGNAIYKTYGQEFYVGGNIFAGGTPTHPQLGFGRSPSPFTDKGGNVFSTPRETETDIVKDFIVSPTAKDPTTKFGAEIIDLFGTNTPTLAIFQPNSSGTKTLGLAAGSPALNAVPQLNWGINPDTEAPEPISRDQRGATRTYPASAGAFEGVVPVTPTPTPTPTTAPAALAKTGSENPIWVTLAAGSAITVGGLLTYLASRLRRRTS